MIDLRSDTVTRPTRAMLEAMMSAEVGDDVLGDDPTVIALEQKVAALLGKPAACFVPSGTMANQTAIRAQTEPGDEAIAHRDSHIIHYETAAVAALSGVQVCALEGPAGLFGADDVASAIRPGDNHYPRSRLLVVENTHNRGGGTVWPLDRFADVCSEARTHGLRIHLDGARLFNACVALMCRPVDYASRVDTVSVCFSKGLGAPAGSAVAGAAETIARVRRFKKMFGGAMRQSGIIAAAAIHALDHHVERLATDHANAQRLARGLVGLPGLVLDPRSVQTNMVFFELDPSRTASAGALPATAVAFCASLEERGVRMIPMGPRRVRSVTHLDVGTDDIDEAVRVVREMATATTRGAPTMAIDGRLV
jgi:threonine aldolase